MSQIGFRQLSFARHLRLCAWVFLLVLASCEVPGGGPERVDADSQGTCVPQCDELACGDDGCGDSCGFCEPGFACSTDGRCLDISNCNVSCKDLNLECGEHCGTSCGTCTGPQDICTDGLCVCAPDCRGRACGDTDGCGGICAPCPADINCTDCPLQLSLLRYETEDDLRYAVLALDYTPNAGSTAPQLADLRLEIDGKAELVTVGAGNALVDSQKRVQQDPLSGRYFTELDGGVMQLLLLSDGAVKPMEAGRWLGLRVLVDDENDPTTTPISISLMAREKTFAPEAADEQLSGVDFNEPVVLWPWMSHED